MFLYELKRRSFGWLKRHLFAARATPRAPFDAHWYLESNPDVAAAGLDPFQHFQRFGQFEGRLPMPPAQMLREPYYAESIATLNLMLWHGYSHNALPKLSTIADSTAHPPLERLQAEQSLADWYFCKGQVELARDALLRAFAHGREPSGALVAGLCRCYQVLNEYALSESLIDQYADALRPVDKTLLTGQLNHAFGQQGLAPVPSLESFQALADYSREEVMCARETTGGSASTHSEKPLVSIIVPVFNAGQGLRVAVQSLRAQAYQNIEIILVDDASTDDSYDVMCEMAKADSRIRLVSCSENLGAYGARNLGMQHADGDLVTVHDSDDWSHPAKLALQVEALNNNPDAAYSTTYWVRVLPDLRMLGSWMLSSPMLQLNHSSAMFRRSVLERCGLWHQVRVAGDTEYLRRVNSFFGKGIEVLPNLPLSLSLVHPQSLTQTKATHVSTIFFGLRRLYREAMDWRHRTLSVKTGQYLGQSARLIPSPLGNLPSPELNFNTLLIADFSRWSDEIDQLLHSVQDDLVLLHIPLTAESCMDPICDQVWEFCHSHGVVFLHPGIRISVELVILTSGDLVLQRPDSLPEVHLRDCASHSIDILHPAKQGHVRASMVHSLLASGGQIPSLAELFDVEFYVANNPDVVQAGGSPLSHFLRYGQAEGRQGFNHRALVLESRLWQGDVVEGDTVEHELSELASNEQHDHQIEAAYASWALARWHASFANWAEALHFSQLHFVQPGQLLAPGHRGPWLIWFTASLELARQATSDKTEKLQALQDEVQRAIAQQGLCADLILAAASVASAMVEPLVQREQLMSLWRELDFTMLGRAAGQSDASMLEFDDLPTLFAPVDDLVGAQSTLKANDKKHHKNTPLVSVIIPCHNSAQSLPTALRALLVQTWPALEVIVVDDASTDQSLRVLSSFEDLFSRKGIRLKIVRQPFNQGAYAARNRGLDLATGDLLTTHDADDWSHPQKIERQVKALIQDPKRAASMSHWVRANEQLQFSYWRPQSSWVHPNMSSLMFRRSVFEKLGYWDRVSVSGDTEFYYRILATYGFGSVVEVLPGTPLAFGRHSEASLTQQGATHIRTQFAGLRHDYIQAARQWHQQAGTAYMAAEPEQRPFAAPATMLRPSAQQIADEIYDERWYLSQYPDVKAAGVDGKKHFIRWGLAEGRVGGPRLASHQQGHYSGLDWQVNQNGKQMPVYMVFAHQVTMHQFGAERSLLDVIENWQVLGRNVVVVVPHDERRYTAALRRISQQVHVQPYTWWHAQRDPEPVVVAACQQLIEQYKPVAVYANTLTLWEPLLAAAASGVPGWVHVRELADGDEGLCQQLGTDAEGIRTHALAHADGLIANSQVVADFLRVDAQAADNMLVIPNQLSVERFQQLPSLPSASRSQPLQVGMLSSNIAKKGLADVIEIARSLAAKGTDIEFKLYGPENAYVDELKRSGLPANLTFMGYADDPLSALETLDVVLNLSHFKESFGRTVLEAMAAGRVVVCYDWGALSELVIEGAGVKVPFANTQAVSQVLAGLAGDKARLMQLSEAARERAATFDVERVRELWLTWLNRIEGVADEQIKANKGP